MDLSDFRPEHAANGAKYFGHKDWENAKAKGMSPQEIADWARNNTDKMSQGVKNVPGGGGLYDQIMAEAASFSAKNTGGGGYSPPPPSNQGTFKKAYGEEFQQNLNEATQAYRPDESKMGNFEGTSHDFRRGVKQENAIKDNDPFGDSWNSIDFYGKYMSMFREAQKGRSDGTSIANKYIFNAAKTNPVNIQALDQQIRTNPLYSNAKAELAKLDTFGDRYANKENMQPWVQPTPPSAYKPPNLQGISNDYMDKIDDIKL